MGILIPVPDEAKQVSDRIRSIGGRPMLSGGYVRDAMRGVLSGEKPSLSKDVDFEVYNVTDLDKLITPLKEIPGADVGEAGKVYGVVKVRLHGLEMDISLPRHEVKTGAGHRGFTVIPDSTLGFEDACARRDFTVNAMLYDLRSQELIDPYGGLEDLAAGILRHVSDRFSEDPLRVLRGVQFAARFGFTMDEDTVRECRSLVTSYPEISKERVYGEWEKIGTRGTHISAALEILRATGWDKLYLQLSSMQGVEQDLNWHPEGDAWTHAGLAADQAARLADEAGLADYPHERAVIVLAALCHDMGKVTHTQVTPAGRIMSHGHAEAGVIPARSFLNSIGCPAYLVKRIIPLIAEHMSTIQAPTKHAVRRLARRLAPATMTELHLVVGADRKGRGNPEAANGADAWLEMAKDLTIEEKPRKGILTGQHLIEYGGMTPGPAFKFVLERALFEQDRDTFSDERGAVEWFQKYYPKEEL